MKKYIEYETPDIEFTRFEMEINIMNSLEQTNGDKVNIGEGESHPETTVEDLPTGW